MAKTSAKTLKVSIQHDGINETIFVGSPIGVTIAAFQHEWLEAAEHRNVLSLSAHRVSTDTLLKIALPANDNMAPLD